MQVYVEVRDKDEVGRRRLRQYLGVIVDLLDETSERTDRQTDRQTDGHADRNPSRPLLVQRTARRRRDCSISCDGAHRTHDRSQQTTIQLLVYSVTNTHAALCPCTL